MPSEPTAEQVELRRRSRQRLIGAIALAFAAVVFVPMLLDPEPRRERAEPMLAIPPKEGAPPLAAVTRPPDPPEPQPARPATAQVADPPAEATGPASGVAAAPEAKPAPATPKLEGYAVQVGAFKEEAKLAQARDKLAAARIAHYIERVSGGPGDLTRLRAGPFPTREAADKAAAQLARAGFHSQVVSLP